MSTGLFLLVVGLLFGWASSPLLQRVAERVIGRWFLRLGFFAAVFAGVAFAQDSAGPVVPQTKDDWVKLVAEVVGLVLTVFIFPYLRNALNGLTESKTASTTVKSIAGVALPFERLAEVFAAKLEHEVEANPTANKSDLLARAGQDFLTVLGDQGVKAFGDAVGALGSNLLPLAQAEIAHKLGDYQLTAATQAGVAAASSAKSLGLADVVKLVAAGPSK
jgi:hypothetical protein